MNFLVVLIVAAGLGSAWYGFTRVYDPKSKLALADPAGAERRADVIEALRVLAFFFLVNFVITTILVFIAAFFITLFAPPDKKPFVDAFGEIINSVSQDKGTLSPLSSGGVLVTLVGTLISVAVSQRVVRGRPLLELGLRPYKALPLDLIMGLLLGPLLFALIWFFETTAGFILASSGPTYNWGELAKWAAIFGAIAVSEELIVRGYLLQTINKAWGGTVAVVASSLFWGLAHIFNPNASLISALNVTVAGLLFAYAYFISEHLWLPMALHFSWNFAEGAIFGYPVSGFQVENSILQPALEGPKAITGGLFGPEGGLVALFAILVGALILYGWGQSRQTPTPKREKK
ncbi:MAG: CPBP family intramembrane metalloprotease [Chloroflexi bacterium]|nr:CPBP family intramembrane metalloprotease [Chloroflexota bacterium]